MLLGGLHNTPNNSPALAPVGDEGGSRGRLPQGLATLPPGAFRNNMPALSDAENLMRRLFQYPSPERTPAPPGFFHEEGRIRPVTSGP